jgi:hypothetical protein
MTPLCKKLLIVLCVSFQLQFLKAQPLHEYYFNGNLNGTAGGPALNQTLACSAAPGSFGSQNILTSLGLCAISTAFCFNSGGGLAYPNPSYIRDQYTINLLCCFGNLSGKTRLIDFSNGTSNPGIYLDNNCLSMAPLGNVGPCPYLLLPNQYYLFSFVRNASGLMTIYIDGVFFTSFSDFFGMYTLVTNTVPVVFFKDDTVVPCESKAGCVKYISITSSVMSGLQILTNWLSICNVLLPVGMNGLVASVNSSEVRLDWNDESDGIRDFEIERSRDAVDFSVIGFVNVPYQNPDGKFTFSDASPQPGINYYRLKRNMNSGEHKFSPVRSVVLTRTDQVEIFPNPANDHVYVGKEQLISMTNALGENVPIKYSEDGLLDASELPNGIFYLFFKDKRRSLVIRH